MDWTHWRGPMMSGGSLEKNLPEKWDAKGEGILWRKEEYATRSTPVIMNGKMYIVCRAFPESTQEGEKTVCLDATTGDLIWESIHNVYLSDAPGRTRGMVERCCRSRVGECLRAWAGLLVPMLGRFDRESHLAAIDERRIRNALDLRWTNQLSNRLRGLGHHQRRYDRLGRYSCSRSSLCCFRQEVGCRCLAIEHQASPGRYDL